MYSSFDKQYLCYLLLGVGTLAPWNAFITAADYYALRYPGYHVDRLLTVCYLPVNFLVLLVFIYAHNRIQQRLRIVAGFIAFTIAVLAMPVIDFLPPGGGSLALMLFLVAICGAADGAAQGALFGEAAVLDDRYTQALIAGTAISGVAISLLRILTKALLPATPAGLRASADLYFLLAAATCGCCVVIHSTVLPSLRSGENTIPSSGGGCSVNNNTRLTVVYNDEDPSNGNNTITPSTGTINNIRDQAADSDGNENENANEASDVYLLSSLSTYQNQQQQQTITYLEVAYQVRVLAMALVFIYSITLAIFPGVLAEDVSSQKLGSWYPIILMFIFNLCDCVGKWLPVVPTFQFHNAKAIAILAVCRVFFIPAFHVATTQGAGGVVIGLLAALLGLSNGYLTASAMILGPKLVEPRAAALCGNIMVLSLIAGLNLGAACGFLWLLV